MSEAHGEDDLVHENAEGYNVTEKKTIQEYTQLDAHDESLAKWKASLGLAADSKPFPVKAGDKRTVVIVDMRLEFPDDPKMEPIHFCTEDDNGVTINEKIVVKEKANTEMVIKFRVQHEIITGLRYFHSVKKTGIRVDKVEEPLGSYAPNTVDTPFYEKRFEAVEMPLGMLGRGNYTGLAKFVDDDKTVHLTFTWNFSVVK